MSLDDLLPTDRWLLSHLAQTITNTTALLEQGEYAPARAEIEHFFWSDLCDNYLELAKARLYQESGREQGAAQKTLYTALLAILKLLAPYLPYVTEGIYQGLFREREECPSLHLSAWPSVDDEWMSEEAEECGKVLLDLLKQVRRYKAEHGLSVGTELETLHIHVQETMQPVLAAALVDIKSATRAIHITLSAYAGDMPQGDEQVVVHV
jgi:valyl-tRNA synthetase